MDKIVAISLRKKIQYSFSIFQFHNHFSGNLYEGNQSLQKNNEIFEAVSKSNKENQEPRESVSNLEKKYIKIEDIDERVKIIDIETKKTSNIIGNFKKDLDKNNKGLKKPKSV